MSAITLKLPDDLAEQLRNREDRLPEILELGLRELNAEGQGRFEGSAEVLEFLAGLPVWWRPSHFVTAPLWSRLSFRPF